VRNLVLLDRAVDATSAARLLAGETPLALRDAFVASYPLTTADNLADATNTLARLVWQGTSTSPENSNAVVLDNDSWLSTERAVAPLARRINKSGQFTVALTLGTKDITQTGPARILTVSLNPYMRNLTLGQERSSLILRVRTRYSGENGTLPELQIPEVLVDTKPQRILISYDGMAADFYTSDKAEIRHFAFGPEVAFAVILKKILTASKAWKIHTSDFSFLSASALFYLVIFFPLGVLLGVAVRLNLSHKKLAPLIILILLFPSLIMETLIAYCRWQPPRIAIIALGGCAIVVSFSVTLIVLRLARASHTGSRDAARSGKSPGPAGRAARNS